MTDISVPVMVDDTRNLQDFPYTRCVYFTIECENPANWTLELGDLSIPFLMFDLSGVICLPSGGAQEFDTPEAIENVFSSIEVNDSLYVGAGDIWMPNSSMYASIEDSREIRGRVYRIDHVLFTAAFRFRRDLLSREEFEMVCNEHRHKIRFSQAETSAFGQWMHNEVEKARRYYKENEALALEWHDDEPEGASR